MSNQTTTVTKSLSTTTETNPMAAPPGPSAAAAATAAAAAAAAAAQKVRKALPSTSDDKRHALTRLRLVKNVSGGLVRLRLLCVMTVVVLVPLLSAAFWTVVSDLDAVGQAVGEDIAGRIAIAKSHQVVLMSLMLGLLVMATFFFAFPLQNRVRYAILKQMFLNPTTNRRTLALLEEQNNAMNNLSNDLYSLTNLMPSAVFLADNSGRITYASDRWLAICGLNPEAGDDVDSWMNHIHPEERGAVEALWRQARADPVFAMSREFRFIRPNDGLTLWLYVQTFANTNNSSSNDSVPTHTLVGSFTDLTERKVLVEQKLAALQMASDANAQRASEAEFHQREQLAFVDMICHEVRNPLNGIINNLDHLLEQQARIRSIIDTITATLPPDQVHPLITSSVEQINSLLHAEESIFHSIDVCLLHQRRITDDVLHISQMQTGQPSLHETVFNLRNVVEAVVSMLRGEMQLYDIELTQTLSPSASAGLNGAAVLLRSDSQRIAQILLNVIGNAVKFTRGCAVRRVNVLVDLIDVASPPASPPPPQQQQQQQQQQQRQRSKLVVSVQDTGVGISKNEINQLFLPFGQANSRTHSRYGDSGMGLFLCKAMLDLLGGTINGSSEPGVGSSFTIEIPVSHASPDSVVDKDKISSIISRDLVSPPSSTLRMHLLQGVGSAAATGAAVNAPSEALRFTPLSTSTPPQAILVEATIIQQPPSGDSDHQRTVRVLVVEDNDINQMILKRQLESVQTASVTFSVALASDGLQGVEVFEGADRPFDVIIMDIEMPTMDGLRATARIRELERDKKHPYPTIIIGLSGNARDEYRNKAREVKMTDYLVKPCRRPELLACISQHLHLPSDIVQ